MLYQGSTSAWGSHSVSPERIVQPSGPEKQQLPQPARSGARQPSRACALTRLFAGSGRWLGADVGGATSVGSLALDPVVGALGGALSVGSTALGARDGVVRAGSSTLGAVTRARLVRSGATASRQAPKPSINAEHPKITANPFRITLSARVNNPAGAVT